jgi:undecaprenyl-diphosphatase
VAGRPPTASALARWLRQLAGVRADAQAVDQAVFDGIAEADTPRLDAFFVALSRSADYSRLWLTTALGMAAFGARARRAAVLGVCAVGLASAVTNLGVKPLVARRRPLPSTSRVPDSRWVRRPESASFPSGHTASAFAFASAAGEAAPLTWVPLHTAAVLVGYARVHTGVHYPSDVVVGAVIGALCGWLTRSLAGRAPAGSLVAARTP